MGCSSSKNTVSPDVKPEAKEKPSAEAPARKLHVVHFNDVGEGHRNLSLSL
jgi:hypothetical protein